MAEVAVVRRGDAPRLPAPGRVAALVLAALTAVAALTTLSVLAALPAVPGETVSSRLATAAYVLGMSALALSGTAVVHRHEHSRIGWLMVITGLAGVLARLSIGVALGHRGGSLGTLLGWLTNWSWVPAQAAALVLLLRFPTGRLPGPHWRWAERAVLAWALAAVLATAFVPGALGVEPLAPARNPLGVEALGGMLDAGLAVLFLALPVLVVVAVAAPVVRWRNAATAERRQIRWIAVAAGLIAVTAPLALLSGGGVLLEGLAYLMLPGAIGYAVLRHRLWGIDVTRRLDRVRHVREEERRRLQRELHDSLGPVLGSISMRAEAARNLLGSGQTDRIDEVLRSIERATSGALVEVRRLIDELGPSALEGRDLASALAEVVTGYAGRDPVMDLRVGELPALDPDVEAVAFHVTAEAVRNVVRHARARICTVRVELHDEALVIEVRDDGRGLGGHPAGVGRRGMAQRAAAVGGSLAVTEGDPGVVVRAVLPEARR